MGLAAALLGSPTAALANEALPAAIADRLDGHAVEFTQSAASQRRHMMIEQQMRAQRGYGRGPAYGRRGYGPPRGYYGPRRGYGYGPRPYGPPPGYGRRDPYWRGY